MAIVIRGLPDGEDEADLLSQLHDECFGDEAPMPDFTVGAWWIGWEGTRPVCFAGIKPGTQHPDMGYLCRAGVVVSARGQGLQRRLIRARERYARLQGWKGCVTDTTDNPPSANSLIGCGYRMFEPRIKWAYPHSCYWRRRWYV